MRIRFLLFFICSWSGLLAQIDNAQVQADTSIVDKQNSHFYVQTFIDVGANNVSEGAFVKNFYRGSYQFQRYTIEAGLQFDLHSNNPNTLTGFDIVGSRDFLIKKFPLDVKAFFMLNRFSETMHETNWGFFGETRKVNHFLFGVGTNFKNYKVNKAARETYNISKEDSKLSENFNFIYVVTAFLKPHTSNWNVGVSITNVDYYVINQSTNPLLNIQSYYKTNSNFTFYVAAWYKQAGVMNINANYFGHFFRGGIKWDL